MNERREGMRKEEERMGVKEREGRIRIGEKGKRWDEIGC